jgi:enoyl-CoA hydratase/carnithine racemase
VLSEDAAAVLLASPWAAEEVGPGPILVEFGATPSGRRSGRRGWPAAPTVLPAVTVAVVRRPDVAPAVLASFDVVVATRADYPAGWVAPPDGLDEATAAVVAGVEARPQASLVATEVLRTTEGTAPQLALTVESLAYSTLQSGPEFGDWLTTRPTPVHRRDDDPAVLVSRHGARLNVTLNRPLVRNAVNAAMRDGLVEAFRMAGADPAIDELVLAGCGPDFCSGGDLTEFGTLPNPVTAHRVRLTRSPALWAAVNGARMRAEVQGACVGAGLELMAWASRVQANPNSFFSLPEVSMGLIPGAGGTASIPRRIGRQRTAYLALSGRRIDAETALGWGLVDRLADTDPPNA